MEMKPVLKIVMILPPDLAYPGMKIPIPEMAAKNLAETEMGMEVNNHLQAQKLQEEAHFQKELVPAKNQQPWKHSKGGILFKEVPAVTNLNRIPILYPKLMPHWLRL